MNANYESVNKIHSLKSHVESVTGNIYNNLTQGVQELKNAYVKYGKSFDEIVGHVDIPVICTKIRIYCFAGCFSIESVTIPNSVTEIGSWAFQSCVFLNNVSIGNGVTKIGEGAFEYCNSLESITIPNSVTEIGSNAFNSCAKLTRIYLKPITPPSLNNTQAFSNTMIIYVPAGSGDTYRSATNWSYHADRIVEDPNL